MYVMMVDVGLDCFNLSVTKESHRAWFGVSLDWAGGHARGTRRLMVSTREHFDYCGVIVELIFLFDVGIQGWTKSA